MSNILKIVLAGIGLILIALFFPFVREVFEVADNNGTGILHMAGTSINNGFIQFLVPFFVVALFIIIIVFVVRKEDRGIQIK